MAAVVLLALVALLLRRYRKARGPDPAAAGREMRQRIDAGLDTTVEAFERLDLTADEKAKIRSGNAMKLFGR